MVRKAYSSMDDIEKVLPLLICLTARPEPEGSGVLRTFSVSVAGIIFTVSIHWGQRHWEITINEKGAESYADFPLFIPEFIPDELIKRR
jgi:hypothetical protein